MRGQGQMDWSRRGRKRITHRLVSQAPQRVKNGIKIQTTIIVTSCQCLQTVRTADGRKIWERFTQWKKLNLDRLSKLIFFFITPLQLVDIKT